MATDLLRPFLKFLAVCAVLIGGASAGKACVNRGDHSLILMFDFQRDPDARKTDIAILKSLTARYAGHAPEMLVRMQPFNLKNDHVTNQMACRLFTYTKMTDAVSRAEALYASERQPGTPHFNKATRLEEDFRELLLSLGQMKVEASDEKVVLIFGNLDYYFEALTTHSSTEGFYLSDGWLMSSESPFSQRVFNVETDRFQDAKVMVITDGSDPLSVRHGKRQFYAAFFNLLGGDLYYFGPAHSQINQPSGLVAQVFGRMLNGEMQPYRVGSVGQASLLQVINRQKSRTVASSEFD